MTSVGLVTIGQSPRSDLTPELKEIVPEGAELVEKGALDGINRNRLDDLEPKSDEETLVTRMRDGTQVTVGKKPLLPRLQGKIDELKEENVDLIALLCSGEFPEFSSEVPLIFPDELVLGTLSSIHISGKLGLLIPSPRQIEKISGRFEKIGFETESVGISPYEKDSEQIGKAATQLRKEDVDLTLLDCFGYTRKMKKRVRERTEKPTILVRSLLGRAISELIA